MKKILFISFAICYFAFGFVMFKIQDVIFNRRLEEMNAKIKQLHSDGYSWDASRKIGATEAGFIPMDSEYKALKED